MKQNHSKISKPSQPNIDFLSSTEAIIAYSDDEEIIRHALISYAITEAITAGDQTALEPYKNVSLFSNISHYEVGSPLRKIKNLTMTMNTLACRAAEEGGAPLVYVRTISAAFAEKIESATDEYTINNIRDNLLNFYCNAVHEHNLKNYEPIARKCYSYILSHLSEDISMRNCALNCHISYEYLSRTIKKNFHSSYSALVHQLRIKRACVYLHSDKSIADIAEAVGYKSSSQFCHSSSKIKGMSPNTWKKLR